MSSSLPRRSVRTNPNPSTKKGVKPPMVVNNPSAQPIPGDCRKTAERVVAQYDVALALAAEALERRVQTVFLVGCGGSLSAMYGAQYFIESSLGSLATSLLTSSEFTCRRPPRLSHDSLVVLGSRSGETPETIEAARQAREAGALIATITFPLTVVWRAWPRLRSPMTLSTAQPTPRMCWQDR